MQSNRLINIYLSLGYFTYLSFKLNAVNNNYDKRYSMINLKKVPLLCLLIHILMRLITF